MRTCNLGVHTHTNIVKEGDPIIGTKQAPTDWQNIYVWIFENRVKELEPKP